MNYHEVYTHLFLVPIPRRLRKTMNHQCPSAPVSTRSKKPEPANITTDDAIWRPALRSWIMEMEGRLGNFLSNLLL